MDSIVKPTLNSIRKGINSPFTSKEPWQIVTITTTTVLACVWFYNILFQNESLIRQCKRRMFSLIMRIPYTRDKIMTKIDEMSSEFEREAYEKTKNMEYITKLMTGKVEKKTILKVLNENLELGDYDWKNGKVSGSVYYFDPELVELVAEVYAKTAYTNPLHPDIFRGVCKMEAEVVRLVANLFHGDENVCGSVTTGGTESILMACKAYRDYAKEEKCIERPEIVVPTTAHAAFDKAAQYFKLKVKHVPLDPLTYEVNIEAMKSAITRNTIMLVGSAPNFPYGTVDNITAIANLGLAHKIPVHVDSCLGGFLTAFMPEAGYPVPISDFALPGVTSISVDTHKYGFTPKGSSVILYREKKYIHHQYTVTTDWPGGVYGSPTVCGSRSGGTIAVCWATLFSFGVPGYVEATREIIHTTKYIEKGLRQIKEIFIFGKPATSVIAIGSNVFDIYRLSSSLSQSGWNLNVLQFPSGIHICVTHMHVKHGVADQFLEDVRRAASAIMTAPNLPVKGRMALYGVAQSLPDRSMVGNFTRCFLDSMYYTRKE